MLRRPPRSKRTAQLLPYATLFRSDASVSRRAAASKTRSRSPGSVSITMRSAVSRSASGMGTDRADGSGEFAAARDALAAAVVDHRSEEHTSELQSLLRSSYAVFCLKKKIQSTDR